MEPVRTSRRHFVGAAVGTAAVVTVARGSSLALATDAVSDVEQATAVAQSISPAYALPLTTAELGEGLREWMDQASPEAQAQLAQSTKRLLSYRNAVFATEGGAAAMSELLASLSSSAPLDPPFEDILDSGRPDPHLVAAVNARPLVNPGELKLTAAQESGFRLVEAAYSLLGAALAGKGYDPRMITERRS